MTPASWVPNFLGQLQIISLLVVLLLVLLRHPTRQQSPAATTGAPHKLLRSALK